MGLSPHNSCILLLLTAVIILSLSWGVSGDFCNENYQVVVTVRKYNYVWRHCWYYRPCRYYYWWWWYHWYWRYWHCRYSYSCRRYRWYYTTQTVTRTRKVCCEGYKGKDCDIPICTDCGSNGVCTAPEECFCGSGTTGPNCELKKCGANKDCYPGTCDGDGDGNCMCSSGFGGTKCEYFKDAGTLTECKVRFQDENLVDTFTAECGKDEYGKTMQHYSKERLPKWLAVDYDLFYNNPDDLPPRPSYIGEAKLGLTASTVKPFLYNTDDNNLWSTGDITCNVAVGSNQDPPSQDVPYQSLDCANVRDSWPNTNVHGYRLVLNITSTSGGFKRYLDDNTEEQTDYYTIKEESEEVVEIVFDHNPPVHCTDEGSCTDENENPCEFYPDITKHGTVLVEWDGWTDADSGLGTFTYKLYKMELNDADQLVEGDTEIDTATLTAYDTMPDITLEEPGLYSMILEVSDAVGNTAKARSLLLYDNSSTIEVLDDNPLSISGAQLQGSNYWITNPQNSLSINWNNRYINRFLHDNKLLKGVKAMQDVKDDVYGNFTNVAIRNNQGISKFGVHVSLEYETIDEKEFTRVDVLTPSYESAIAQNAGTVIYVYVFASDIMGNAQVEYVPIGVDTTDVLLNTGGITFTVNENATVPNIPYASSVSIPVEDPQSGILSINYTLVDVVTDEIVIDSSQEGQQHGRHTEQAQCDDDGGCYCAALGGCFNNKQLVWLNNCLLEGRDGRVFRLDYQVYNGAGIETSESASLGKFDNIKGPGLHPSPDKATFVIHKDAFYKVTLYWEYLPTCYEAQNVIISYMTGSGTVTKTVLATANQYEVDNLLPGTDYEVEIMIQYADNKQSSPVLISFTTLEHSDYIPEDDNGGDPEGGLSTGAIIGIVIVGLIICALVAGVIVLLVRRKQDKPMVPPVVRDAGQRIRDRLSRAPAVTNQGYFTDEPDNGQMYPNKAYDNAMDYSRPVKAMSMGKPPPYDATFKVAYVGEEDGDIYTYGNMDTEEDATWKVSNDRLIMGKTLPDVKGKFADLKLATLHTDSGTKTVVAKMNKVGATDIEKLLMTAKMNFLATSVPANENLLQFIAAVPPPQGPMILMEYCSEGKLSDWLKKQKKITEDVADSLINFSIQVAAGMTHLHGAGILHRRLGARNILLTMNMSQQIVAKVSGFGPMKGEQTGEQKTKGDRVPFKWMAPEQFEVQSQGRIYSPMTDVWSYGILLHEIFSKGEQPYPDMTVGQVKDQVAKGYRMPKQPDCPDFIYEEIMQVTWNHSSDDRPTFDMIHTALKGYFQGGAGGQEEYVYDAN